MIEMNRHLFYYVKNLIFLLWLELTEYVNLFHYLHDNFTLFYVLLTNYCVECLTVEFKTRRFCLYTDVCCSFRIVEHRNLTEHLSLHYRFYINFLRISPSIAMKLSFINDEDLIPLISLSDDYSVLFIGLFSHCWD